METLEQPKVKDLSTYTDDRGITHIHVIDTGQVFELIEGEWVENEDS